MALPLFRSGEVVTLKSRPGRRVTIQMACYDPRTNDWNYGGFFHNNREERIKVNIPETDLKRV